MSDGMIEGFQRRTLPGAGVEVDALVGGSGPPLLLLHGWPQTRRMWAAVAPRLAERFTVVAPDLRGYGRSGKPEGGGDHAAYSKRTMARDQVETMRALGFDRFDVAGHDRGGRVAYRLALDTPGAVRRVVVMDIVPTAEVWRSFDAAGARRKWHWTFQIQDEAERMINADPQAYGRYVLGQLAGPGFRFDPANMADYLACLRDPATVHGLCEDYRAGATVDVEHDEADRDRRRIAAPLLVLWGEAGSVARGQPLETWRRWADDLRGRALPGGHFVPEEAPDATVQALAEFLR